MRKLFLLLAFLCAAVEAAAQNPDLVLNPGSSYVEVGRGIVWGTTFNRTYLVTPNSPNASICVYVVNNNPSSAHSFTTTISQTADSQVPDFSNNQGRYNSVPLISMPASVAALSMGSGFTQATAAAKVAIKFSGAATQAGSPDTADVFLVQTTSGSCGSASTSNQVQGTTAPGATVTGNPLLIGGKDLSGNAQFAGIGTPGIPGAASFGLAIGTTGNGITSSMNTYTSPNTDGKPLGVYIFARNSTGSSTSPITIQPGGICTSTSDCGGLVTETSGYAATINTTETTSITRGLWSGANDRGLFQGCYVSLISAAGTGTTPTLDVFVQDSPDNVNWNDRLHFAQVTTLASKQAGGFATFVTTPAPAAMTDGTLAAATSKDGPIGLFGRLKIAVTGTTPSFAVTYVVACR